jgi:hypothetical protein
MKLLSLFAIATLVLFGAVGAQAQPHRCGGIAGFQCPRGEVCHMTGQPHPDQMGVCVPQRGCPRIYRPVCGSDNRTYPNACVAEHAGVDVVHPGQCRRPPICPRIYRPVCGVNHHTYPNACEARRAGVMIAHPGRCLFRR